MRILLLILLVCTVRFAVGGATPQPPNILIFITDDHDQADSSPYGATDLKTPHMERLAKAGMTFTHAFVPSPSCAPSRAALLTGVMPARNGAEPNHSKPRAEIKKFPAYLQELGYEVVSFGKVPHYGHTGLYGFDFAVPGKWLDTENIPEALKYLRERRSTKPICMFVGVHEPHVPWPENRGYDPAKLKLPPTHVDTPETREWRARYNTAITDADEKFGQVYNLALEKLGANTLVIFTSDHGAQWPLGKWNLYEAGIRVPLIISWPGVIASGSRTDAMVSWVDLLPTLVEIAGGHPPKTLDGRSFASVLRGSRKDHRERIFSTHTADGPERFNNYPIRSVRTREWKYILNLHPEREHHTHIDRAKDVDGASYWRSWVRKAESDPAAAAVVGRYYNRPPEELYNLPEDPHEQRNLANDPKHTERLEQMRAELRAWMKQQGDSALKP